MVVNGMWSGTERRGERADQAQETGLSERLSREGAMVV